MILPFSWYGQEQQSIAAPEAATEKASTGKIAGKIVDRKTNKPLAGANVILEGTTLGAASAKNGDYFLINVPEGLYNVKVAYLGYKSLVVQNVSVKAMKTTKFDFKLEPANMEIAVRDKRLKIVQRTTQVIQRIFREQ